MQRSTGSVMSEASHNHQERKNASSDESVTIRREEHQWVWTLAVSITIIIILAGLVIGYLKPGPIAGAILPIGITLWWVLYKLADRLDQRA
jgi:hypothetical protein